MFKYLIKGHIPREVKPVKVNGRWGGSVLPIPCAFDIETTNDVNTKAAFMYHWQAAVGDNVIAGRTWDEFFDFMHWLTQPALLPKGRLIFFIHNMGFEMSFLLPQIYRRGLLERVFAKEEREPLEVVLTNGITFRDTMALTNMSLASLAANYTETQKLKGDLDYSIRRNSKTPLTFEETNYCINDVLILKEYAEQLHVEYTMNGKRIPMTSTGIVRQYVREQIPVNRRFIVNKTLSKQFPRTPEQYDYIMKYLFRGGYTHANTAQCNKVLKNVVSYDFTSAYPSIMLHEFFPVRPFKQVQDLDIRNIEFLINTGRPVIFIADFYDIEATTYHCVESKLKLINFDKHTAIFENGRLYRCSHIQVMLTDVDYLVYKEFYNWSDIKVVSAVCSQLGQLPDYLYKSVLEFYRGKKELKGKVKNLESEYTRLFDEQEKTGEDLSAELAALKTEIDNTKKQLQKVKGMLNSCYGMTVSRLNLSNIEYGIDPESDSEVVGWYKTEGKSYAELINKQFLSPYWGIYVTAYCRRNILRAIKHFDKYAVYSDTDSIKILSTAPGIDDYFAEYNKRIRARNMDICAQYDLDPYIYEDLGTFDNEGTYTRFKTLGAKRYIYEKDGHIEPVIAGLPKSIVEQYVEENGIESMFTKFSSGMYFECADKNVHHYTDEVTADIEGEIMHELGSCYIYETSFRMKVDQAFLELITERESFLNDPSDDISE